MRCNIFRIGTASDAQMQLRSSSLLTKKHLQRCMQTGDRLLEQRVQVVEVRKISQQKTNLVVLFTTCSEKRAFLGVLVSQARLFALKYDELSSHVGGVSSILEPSRHCPYARPCVFSRPSTSSSSTASAL
ncbi:hypothetical protein DVH05_008166 [Phytophthora capsici]|nr:hypothetical protein DVH05_008166 [Phytophthora capsici]